MAIRKCNAWKQNRQQTKHQQKKQQQQTTPLEKVIRNKSNNKVPEIVIIKTNKISTFVARLFLKVRHMITVLLCTRFKHMTKTRLFKYTENFTWKFSDKNSNIFHIYAQNIDCGYSLEPPCRDGYNEYPQTMFMSRNKKNNVYPCKPQFYYIKSGVWGGQN